MQKLSGTRYGWPLWNPPLVRPPIFQLAMSLQVACTGFSLPKHGLGPPNPLLFHPGNQSNLVLKLLANHDNKLYWLLSGFPGAPTHHQFPHPTRIWLTSPEQDIASIGKESRYIPFRIWSGLNASLSGQGCPTKQISHHPSAVALPLGGKGRQNIFCHCMLYWNLDIYMLVPNSVFCLFINGLYLFINRDFYMPRYERAVLSVLHL